MKIFSLLLQPAKAVLKHPQSRRFATILRLADDAKRLDCGGSPPLFHGGAAAVLIIFFALGAMAQTTNALSEAEIHGRQLAQQILKQRPTANFTNTGVLQIRDGTGNRTSIPVKIEIIVTPTSWSSTYIASITNQGDENLVVIHANNLMNTSSHFAGSLTSDMGALETLPAAYSSPFAHSDFWIGDLSFEFLRWPDQKILKGETMSGVFCRVLESTNPNPPTNGYSNVVSWIDNESLGIVQAKAYDAKGKLLKEFHPKDVKKVNGQWQVGSMIIDNIQTGSRTTLKLDLTKE